MAPTVKAESLVKDEPGDFDKALSYIAALERRGWRMGLDRMRAFVEMANLEDAVSGAQPRYIHIAGTNGKGSVTAYVQSILIEEGLQTGAFFSPYVYDVRERVQFNRQLIGQQEFANLTNRLAPIADQMIETEFGGPTEFEFKTALGFAFWKERKADWVALETGLGGRLDATSVVSPSACAIVSIGMDHMSVLGESLEEIAYEKAGIIRPDVPVVIGQVPKVAQEVICSYAKEQNAPVWIYGREFTSELNDDGLCIKVLDQQWSGVELGIRGAMQPHNAAVAVATVMAAGALVTPNMTKIALNKAFAPGRFQLAEFKGKRLILDGAHNEDSAVTLACSLRQAIGEGKRCVLLTTMLQGHEPERFYGHLAPYVKATHVPPIDFFRSRDASEVAESLAPLLGSAIAHTSLEQAFDSALNDLVDGDILLVTGSFYLVGNVGRLIGLSGEYPYDGN